MTPAEQHAWLLARWQAHHDLAAAATPGPWQHVDFADPHGQPATADGQPSTYMGCGSVITMGERVLGGDIAAPNGDLYPHGGYSPSEDMAHIAANDPAFVIAVARAALEVLGRHAPYVDGDCVDHVELSTDGGDCYAYHAAYVPWPCPEVLAWASPWAGRDDYPEELKR